VVQELGWTVLSRYVTENEATMNADERVLLEKAAADPKGQVAIKHGADAWDLIRDRLHALARLGHLRSLGQSMGPHLGGTFSVWAITAQGRAAIDAVR